MFRPSLFLVSCILFGLTLFLSPLTNAAHHNPPSDDQLFSPKEQQYLAGKGQITMCIDPDWLPLEAIIDGKHVGMTAEYMELFSETIGVPITLVPTKTWTESLTFAKARKCDIFSLAMPTPDRTTYMTFTTPYLNIPLVMAAKIDTPFIDDITRLTDKKIGMVQGYAFNELLRTRYPEMQVVDVDSVQDGLGKVAQGEIFGFVGTLATVGYTIQKHFTGELKVSGKFDERWSLGIGSRNDEPLLKTIFEKAIQALDPAKEQEILNHWIAVRFEKGTDYTLLWKILPFACAILLVLLYHNYTLKRYTKTLQQQNREIQQQAIQLQQAEEQLLFTQHAVETSVFPIIWVKHSADYRNTAISHVNQAAAKALGYERDDLLGRSIAEIDSSIVDDRWEDVAQRMKQTSFSNVTATFKRKDGSTFPVELFINYFEYQNEAYHFTFFIDISRQQDMEKKLHRSMKMEAVGLMAGGVAHDLNNILSALTTYPEILLLKLPSNSPLREHIEKIRKAGTRAAEIVEDMLTVTRGTAAAKKVESLNSVITEILDSPEFQQIQRSSTPPSCTSILAPDLLNISCSVMHIRKSILNLLFNAAEAVGENGTITIRTENCYIDEPVAENQFIKPGEYVLLSISDNGPGISTEDQKHIFDPFYSKKVMGKSGTGLGLTIVKNTVQDHDGDILLTSDNSGTTFTLYFPATRNSVDGSPSKEMALQQQGAGEKILVVDDEDLQRDIASELLTTLGFQVQSCGSGEAAIELAKKESFDLLLLDMLMEPGINGRECFEQVQQIHPDIKAIIVSGYSKSDEVKRALSQGVSHYIRKPYTLQQLSETIKQTLHSSA